MPTRPKTPKPPPAPKPWRRESGAYRSADDRFTIEGGGAGRWFVTDAETLDELGLARTTGPFDTLDEAKDAAAAQRERGSEASPLAAKLAAAKERPPATGAGAEAATARAARAASPDRAAADEAPEPAVDADAHAPAQPAPEPAPPPRTWLDELAEGDAAAARSARRAIDALEALGIDDADAVVRRDVLGRQPAVAARLLGRSLAAALATALDPGSLTADARRALPRELRALEGVDDAALAAYAAFVAARVLDATLAVVAGEERAEEAGKALPGWRLVERPADAGAEPRRLIVTPADAKR